jgi:hypothetical protein
MIAFLPLNQTVQPQTRRWDDIRKTGRAPEFQAARQRWKQVANVKFIERQFYHTTSSIGR